MMLLVLACFTLLSQSVANGPYLRLNHLKSANGPYLRLNHLKSNEGDTTVCRPCLEGEPDCAFPGNADQDRCNRCADKPEECAPGYCDCTTYNPNGRPKVTYPGEVCRACTAEDDGCVYMGAVTDQWCVQNCGPVHEAEGGQCFKEYCVCETCDKTLEMENKEGGGNYASCAGTYRKTALDHCDEEEFYNDAQNIVLRYFSGSDGFYKGKWYLSPGYVYDDKCGAVSGSFHRSTNKVDDVDQSLWSAYVVQNVQDICTKRDLQVAVGEETAVGGCEGCSGAGDPGMCVCDTVQGITGAQNKRICHCQWFQAESLAFAETAPSWTTATGTVTNVLAAFGLAVTAYGAFKHYAGK